MRFKNATARILILCAISVALSVGIKIWTVFEPYSYLVCNAPYYSPLDKNAETPYCSCDIMPDTRGDCPGSHCKGDCRISYTEDARQMFRLLPLAPFLPQFILAVAWVGGVLIGAFTKPRKLEILIIALTFAMVTIFLVVFHAH